MYFAPGWGMMDPMYATMSADGFRDKWYGYGLCEPWSWVWDPRSEGLRAREARPDPHDGTHYRYLVCEGMGMFHATLDDGWGYANWVALLWGVV